MTDYEQLTIRSRADWRRWLEDNHNTASGVWLVRFKKNRGSHVAYDDVVEEALAFGWIDSQPRRLDDTRSQLLLTRRKKGSRWSKANKTRIAGLRERGLMTTAGEAAVQRAHDNGTWDALNPVEALREPDDLRRQLDAHPPARQHWDAFPPSTRRAILEWILTAKQPTTRVNRIAETVEKAAINIRAKQWRQPEADRDRRRLGL